MRCEIESSKVGAFLGMIDKLVEKLGGDGLENEFIRLRRATQGHITIKEAVYLLYSEFKEKGE